MSDDKMYVKWGVFWAISAAMFVFAAGCYAFSYYGQQNSMQVIVRISEKLTDAIVANDRMRQTDKTELSCKVDNTNSENRKSFEQVLSQMSDIKCSVARIQK